MINFVVREASRSYKELPLRLMLDFLPIHSTKGSIAEDSKSPRNDDRQPTVAERDRALPNIR